jgi:hypothetical protein
MEQHIFFAFSLIAEVPTEKVLEFVMSLKSICNQNLGLIEQHNVFLKSSERLIDIIIFVW